MFRFPLKNILSVLLCALGLWYAWPEGAAVAHWKGRPAPEAPLQESKLLPPPWEKAGYRITPLAFYRVSAVVLSREAYRWDRGADLSPLDLALGWAAMSEENVVKALEISQSNRWYHYRWEEAPPIGPELIVLNSSNHHLIPANEAVRKALTGVRRHSLVELEGHLVEVSHPDGWKWRSSLRREDTGDGACEVLWVEKVGVKTP